MTTAGAAHTTPRTVGTAIPAGSGPCSQRIAYGLAPQRPTPPGRIGRHPHHRPLAHQVATQRDRAAPGTDAGETEAFLAELRRGDDRAAALLVQRYGGRMLATARRLVRDDDLAADCVQDAFMSAFRHIERFEGRADLGTWLHRITVNAALMKLRTRQRRPEHAIDEVLPRFADDGAVDGGTGLADDDAELAMDRLNVQQAVRAAIAALPDTLRTIIVLRDIEGQSTEAAATTLGISVGAAKTRLHRARLALRALLEPTFGAEIGSPRQT